MIYRVVIIDNGNQVSLTKLEGREPVFEVSGEDVFSDEVKAGMVDSLNKLEEIFK